MKIFVRNKKVAGGVGGQKHINIILGRSDILFDALIEQTTQLAKSTSSDLLLDSVVTCVRPVHPIHTKCKVQMAITWPFLKLWTPNFA